jgi:hypothetical protein
MLHSLTSSMKQKDMASNKKDIQPAVLPPQEE